jgi:hypothetical protein
MKPSKGEVKNGPSDDDGKRIMQQVREGMIVLF